MSVEIFTAVERKIEGTIYVSGTNSLTASFSAIVQTRTDKLG